MCFATIGLALGASSATAAMAGMTAVSTAVSAVGAVMQYQQAKVQADMQQQQFDTNKLLASRSMLEQARQLSIRQEQERAAALDRKRMSNIEAAQLQGRIVASAGEAGVAGMSISNLLADVERTRLNNEGTINRNLEAVNQQSDVERKALLTQAEGRINSVQQGVRPSLLATGLQIGGIALDNYRTYRGDMKSVLQPNLSTGN